jgi:hypothetical protein
MVVQRQGADDEKWDDQLFDNYGGGTAAAGLLE